MAAPPVEGLNNLVASNGAIGVLMGIPFLGDSLEAQAVLAPEPHNSEDAIWLLPMKILTPDEYEWAMGVEDGSRAMELARKFLPRSRNLSWPTRRSILPEVISGAEPLPKRKSWWPWRK